MSMKKENKKIVHNSIKFKKKNVAQWTDGKTIKDFAFRVYL